MTKILSTCVLAVFAVMSAHASVIFADSFNPYTGIAGPSFSTVTAGGTINSWTVGGASVDWIGNYWPGVGGNGDASVDMSGNGPGSLSTILPTLAGDMYTLSFYIAGNPEGGSAQKLLHVQVGNLDQTVTFDTTGHSISNMGWAPQSFTFTALGNDVLTFTSLENSPYGPALDEVAVSSSAAVPEPGTYVALLGLAGIIIKRRPR
jgi:choice-of-anchor C domain-containing protein